MAHATPQAPKPKRYPPVYGKPRRVKLPNGLVLQSSWYEHPVFGANGRLRLTDEAVKRIQRKARDVN